MSHQLSQIAEEILNQSLKTISDKSNPDLIRDTTFPEQDAFVTDPSQFIAALCTRRAGKTNALALRFVRTMLKHPGSLSRYIALTRDSAKDIMWPVLEEINDKYDLKARMIESTLTMILPNKSRLRLLGADMKNFIRRLRGAKSPAVAIDEAQEFGDHITNLIDDILTPTLADYKDSWLALTGTPGAIPRGLFYDITENKIGDYAVHKWSLYQNPYLPDAQSFVDKLKKKKAWDDTTPAFRREYMGQWVLDLDSLLIKWDKSKNDYQSLAPNNWNYILGIDLGFKDSDALAVLAWSEKTPDIYLVEEIVTTGQDISSLIDQINRLYKRYDISKAVMDTGGLGKKISEEITRRHSIPVQAADKARKMENVAFLNDYLRLGKFKAKSNSRFVSDSFQVQIDWDRSTPDKIKVKENYHSDIIDAVLYAFKESPAYTYRDEVKKPNYGSPEWSKEEETEMERAAVEYFTAEQEKLDDDWMY